jgi:hypothetical protein
MLMILVFAAAFLDFVRRVGVVVCVRSRVRKCAAAPWLAGVEKTFYVAMYQRLRYVVRATILCTRYSLRTVGTGDKIRRTSCKIFF